MKNVFENFTKCNLNTGYIDDRLDFKWRSIFGDIFAVNFL